MSGETSLSKPHWAHLHKGQAALGDPMSRPASSASAPPTASRPEWRRVASCVLPPPSATAGTTAAPPAASASTQQAEPASSALSMPPGSSAVLAVSAASFADARWVSGALSESSALVAATAAPSASPATSWDAESATLLGEASDSAVSSALFGKSATAAATSSVATSSKIRVPSSVLPVLPFFNAYPPACVSIPKAPIGRKCSDTWPFDKLTTRSSRSSRALSTGRSGGDAAPCWLPPGEAGVGGLLARMRATASSSESSSAARNRGLRSEPPAEANSIHPWTRSERPWRPSRRRTAQRTTPQSSSLRSSVASSRPSASRPARARLPRQARWMAEAAPVRRWRRALCQKRRMRMAAAF
mmetsp:Transcript_35234/g.97460  ORF Transcript_35234/g.97460 Transcript_35234/m.97460 type:complete len:358 (-) Transcript_35234:130-1203(-)